MPRTLPNAPLRPATLLVRGGQNRSSFDEMSEPVHLTSGFMYESAEQAEETFLGTVQHFQYSRFGNPTIEALQGELAALEGAEACRATASGMAAVHGAMLAHLKTGDRVVASRALFGSCHWIVSTLLPRYGIETVFVDGTDLDQWRDGAVRKPAAMVLLETPSNPMLELVDLPAVCRARPRGGRRGGGGQRLRHAAAAEAADDGRGRRRLFRHEAFRRPGPCAGRRRAGQPQVGGRGAAALHPQHRAEHLPLQRLGDPQGAGDAAPARARHVRAAPPRVADFLAGRPEVARVLYPFLADHPQQALARAQMSAGGTLVTFDVADQGDGARPRPSAC